MNNQPLETSTIASSEVIELYKAAHDFCLTIEEHYKFDKEFFFRYCQRILPFLYLRGALLPECECYDWIDNDRYVTSETWQDIYNSLLSLFEDKNTFFYWNNSLKEPIESSMSENITDIYQDLKDFVFLYSKPSFYAKSNAVYYVRRWYYERWGYLILLTLQNMHHNVFQQYCE